MIGTGLTPEGINQNDMIYDLMNEMGTWINQSLSSTQIQDWVASYAARRYGTVNDSIVKAWRYLTKSVYNCTDGRNNLRVTVITALPSINIVPHVWFDEEDLYEAFDIFVAIADWFSNVETFRYAFVWFSILNVMYHGVAVSGRPGKSIIFISL